MRSAVFLSAVLRRWGAPLCVCFLSFFFFFWLSRSLFLFRRCCLAFSLFRAPARPSAVAGAISFSVPPPLSGAGGLLLPCLRLSPWLRRGYAPHEPGRTALVFLFLCCCLPSCWGLLLFLLPALVWGGQCAAPLAPSLARRFVGFCVSAFRLFFLLFVAPFVPELRSGVCCFFCCCLPSCWGLSGSSPPPGFSVPCLVLCFPCLCLARRGGRCSVFSAFPAGCVGAVPRTSQRGRREVRGSLCEHKLCR